ncbi:MAG: LuxR family transcriptional regulator [Paracoccaceae bacterium]
MDIIDLGAQPDGESRFDEFLSQICDRLGFDHAAYAGINPVQGTIHGHVTYPDEWKLHYAKKGFQRIDPTLTTAGRSIAPVDWSRLERDEKFTRVFKDAVEFGIGDRGMTVPVRGPYGELGMLSVSRSCPETEWVKLLTHVVCDLQSAAVHLHDTVMRSDILSRALRHPQLSSRELEILQWVAAGKSQQDIGDILSISHRTVEVHLRSAREKLFALTTPQAVGRAIGLGLIYPL